MAAALEFDAACTVYDGQSTVGPLTAEVHAGEVVGLLGANGAGKSTVIKMATGLLGLSSGTVRVYGARVTLGTLPHGCAALLEQPAFLERVSARDNLLAASAGRRERTVRIDDVLGLVGLDPDDRRAVKKYSQGMRQRLGIARVLLARPSVLFLDEPTNGLDPEGFRWIRDLVETLAADGTAIVISSHLLGELQSMVSGAIVLRDGAVVTADRLSTLTERHSDLASLYFDVSGRDTDD